MISTIAISSAEYEQGFSAVNWIVTPFIFIDDYSNLLVLNLVGAPLISFDPKTYVGKEKHPGHSNEN